jgi:hypothetical protein
LSVGCGPTYHESHDKVLIEAGGCTYRVLLERKWTDMRFSSDITILYIFK